MIRSALAPARRRRTALAHGWERLEGRSLMATGVLVPGNPLMIPTPTEFKGVGTADTTAAINSFEAAIGGSNNGASTTPATTGFRTINWDAVTLDGKDFGGGANATVISPGNTVGIPQNRFQTRGVFFDSIYAVSNNGFATVNTNAAGLFPAFSTANTFASINDNKLDIFFVTPTADGSTPAPAATRGFGAVFLNSEIANASTIEYFQGDRSLGKFSVPTGTQGQAEFLGELFSTPVVTRVSITLGTDTLFSFNGTTFTAGGPNDATHNLVATDDFVYAEPTPSTDLPTVATGPQGTNASTAKFTAQVGSAFTGNVATFSSNAPGVTAKSFFAVINWGDGHLSNGTITANGSGGFDVSGTNTYDTAGLKPVTVAVYDYQGNEVDIANTAQVNKQATSVTVTASPSPSFASRAVTLTATVTGAGSTPGTVTFFDGTTAIGTAPLNNGKATFTTSTLTPGSHSITATYNGDSTSATSTSTAVSQVVNGDVTSLFRITRRLRRGGRKPLFRLTITNISDQAVGGPLLLALDNLPANVSLPNAAGTTKNLAPIGSPYLILTPGTGGIAAGASQTLNLVLLARRGRVNFTPRILSGVANP